MSSWRFRCFYTLPAVTGCGVIALDEQYEDLMSEADGFAGRARWPAESVWYLLYTSGTTGRPKGVIYVYRMAIANYVNIGSCIDLRSTDVPGFWERYGYHNDADYWKEERYGF